MDQISGIIISVGVGREMGCLLSELDMVVKQTYIAYIRENPFLMVNAYTYN
ncbi:9876_t:CDS:2 [Ambispora gerdemannii]|uniref:9876_t:CDS:1 n=1 Tax=Ambispora gerdemannii TaxID=144530 RepID=A0A9N8YVH6_9GLOM|nr:9876_t:CDS:2 [Ambispora gerdemannii]